MASSASTANIDSAFDSLLQSVAFFSTPNDASRKIVMGQLSTQFNSKKFAIEPALRPATTQLSALLDLDELQTHILLKRYIKDSEDEAALEMARAANKTMDLSLDAMSSILSFYFDERLALLKSTQAILMLGVDTADFKPIAEKLIKSGLEEKTFALIRSTLALLGPINPTSSLEPQGAIVLASSSAVSGGGGGGLYARMATVMKALTSSGGAIGANTVAWLSSSHSSIREQLYRECCELLSILFFIYELPGNKNLLPSQGMKLRALELVRIGSNLFPNHPSQYEFGSSKLAEQLLSLLILSTLNLSDYINLPSHASSATAFDETVALSSSLDEICKEIKSWGATESNALLILVWSSIAKLVEPYRKEVGDAAFDLQRSSMSCNGFKGMIQSLISIPGLSTSSFGQLTRNLLMYAVSVIGIAYELSPRTLTRDLLYDYLSLVRLLVAGDASSCTAVWEDLDLTKTLRSALQDARSLFPADYSTLVQMLLMFSVGPEATIASYKFLQSVPHLSILHDISDHNIAHCFSEGSDEETVALIRPALWNLAPTVSTMVLPEGIQGLVIPLPAILSHLELSKKLICWDVKGTHGSFGQLLLLGRAAHCLSVIDCSLRTRSPIDQASLESLLETIDLMSRFCLHGSELLTEDGTTIVRDVMSLSINLSSGAKCSWLEIASNTASVLVRLSKAGFLLPSSSVQRCFTLMESVATQHPLRVLSSIHQVDILCPSKLFGAGNQSSLSPLTQAVNDVLSDTRYAALSLGLLPGWTSFVSEVEAKEGDYAALVAFLDLSSNLLRAGHHADPLPAYVLYVMHEVLPLHQRLPFKTATARWKLKGAIVRLLDAAISSGAESEPSLAEDRISGLKITPISAHVISHLLLIGPALLSSCLPPSAEYFDYLRASDAASIEGAAAEGAIRALLQLLSKLLVSTAAWRKGQGSSNISSAATELPLESFLLRGDGGSSAPPISLIVSLVAHQEQQPEADEMSRISALAVTVLRVLIEAGRAISSSFTEAVAGSLSSNSQSLSVIRSVLKVNQTTLHWDRDSTLFVSAVVDLIEAAAEVPVASEILDVILFPTGLDPSFQDKAFTPPPVAGSGEVALASNALAVASDAPKTVKSSHPPPWSFLDSLIDLMSHAAELLEGSESEREVLSLGFKAMSVLWQLGGAPVHFLRLQSSTWSAIEACLTLQPQGGAGAEDLWLLSGRNSAWRVILLEVHLTKRPVDSSASPFWKLLDSLVQKGTLSQAVKSSTLLKSEIESTDKLSSAVKACTLELGARFYDLLGSGSTDECNLPVASQVEGDVRLVNQFLASVHLPFADLGSVHRLLLAEPLLDEPEEVDAHSKALTDWIRKTPLGSSLINRCSTATEFETTVMLGQGYVLRTPKLSGLLSSCLDLMTREALLSTFAELNIAASLVSVRLSTLQASSMLMSSLSSKDPTLFRPASKDFLHSAVEAALASTAQLIKCFSNESIVGASSFSSLLLPHGAASSLTSWKLLVQMLGAQRLALSKSSGPQAQSASSPALTLFPYGAPRVAAIPEARTLFPATPSPAPRQSQLTSPTSSDPSASDLAVFLLPLCTLMSTWCRNAATGNLGMTPQILPELIEISNGIMSSVLMVLIPTTRGLDGALISVLSGALPHLCSLCMENKVSSQGISVPVAIQLVTELVRLLPSQEWLPILKTCLDLPSIMSRSSSLERGEVGTLQLATIVSRSAVGARNLLEQDALGKMTDLARTMLSAKDVGLAPFVSLELPLHIKMTQAGQGGTWDVPAISRPPISSQPVDTSLAYKHKQGSETTWSPAHQQWCVLLSFFSTLIRSLGQHFNIESQAIDFLSTTEPRLLLACMPPPATPSQPLTIAMLLETEKSLFLLNSLAQYVGTWHMAMPGSLARFRTVSSSFVAFAASMTAKSPPLFVCTPQSSAEDVMGKATGLTIEEGWFKACDIGSQRPGSEYSTRLAELVYSSVYLSLSFLMSSSPQLGDGEGTMLGPMWPRSRDLCIIQDQCVLVLLSLSNREQTGIRSEAEARKKHVGQLILKVLNAVTDFLSIIGYPPTRRNVEQTIKERIRGLEESLANGEVPNAQFFISPLSPGSPLTVR